MVTFLNKDGLTYFWSKIKSKFLLKPTNTPISGSKLIYNGTVNQWSNFEFNRKLHTTTLTYYKNNKNIEVCKVHNDLLSKDIEIEMSTFYSQNILPIFLNSNSSYYNINFMTPNQFTGDKVEVKFIGMMPENSTIHLHLIASTGANKNTAVLLSTNCCLQNITDATYITFLRNIVENTYAPTKLDNFAQSLVLTLDYYNINYNMNPKNFYINNTINYYSSNLYLISNDNMLSEPITILLKYSDANVFHGSTINIVCSDINDKTVTALPYVSVSIHATADLYGKQLN